MFHYICLRHIQQLVKIIKRLSNRTWTILLNFFWINNLLNLKTMVDSENKLRSKKHEGVVCFFYLMLNRVFFSLMMNNT